MLPINCPVTYYIDCLNAPLKCIKCSASGKSTGKLLYKPQRLKFEEHPAYIKPQTIKKQVDSKKSKSIKKGYTREKELSKELDFKRTVRSGAMYHDGDLIGLQGLLKLDCKVKNIKGISITAKEIEVAKSAKVNSWLLTNKDNDTYMIIEFNKFKEILELLKNVDSI